MTVVEAGSVKVKNGPDNIMEDAWERRRCERMGLAEELSLISLKNFCNKYGQKTSLRRSSKDLKWFPFWVSGTKLPKF